MSVVEFCARLLQTESTPGRERQAIELAAEEMADLGYDDVRIDEHGNLIGRVGPEAGGPVLVIEGHIDTIPLHSGERWSHDPFGAEVVDGVMYGLGASDMKGPVAAIVHGGALAKQSAAKLRGTLYVVASIAEEMMEGATLDRSFGHVPIDYCVIAEATALKVATAQRGRAKVEVEVHGRSAHAANAWRGQNAAEIAAEIVIAARELPPVTHPLLGKRDVNLIDIHSEPYPSVNTIPDDCLARFDVRFLPGETAEGLLATFRGLAPEGAEVDVRYFRAAWRTYVGEEYEVDEFAASWETPREHPLVKGAEGATGAELSTYQFCTNGSYFAGIRGIPTIGYGPAQPEEAHTADESVPIEHLERAVTGYRDITLALLT
jgi:putative selenium metabolism hydrolase